MSRKTNRQLYSNRHIRINILKSYTQHEIVIFVHNTSNRHALRAYETTKHDEEAIQKKNGTTRSKTTEAHTDIERLLFLL